MPPARYANDGDETSIYQWVQLVVNPSDADNELHLPNLSRCRAAD
jgi:hypothetical protein